MENSDIFSGLGYFPTSIQKLTVQDVTDIAWTGYDGGINVQEFCNRTVSLIDQKQFLGKFTTIL
jgi:hypothetical protein